MVCANRSILCVFRVMGRFHLMWVSLTYRDEYALPLASLYSYSVAKPSSFTEEKDGGSIFSIPWRRVHLECD